MDWVLMTIPPVFCASSSASADLPLAVGPAISTALLKSCLLKPCLLKPCETACMSLVATLICNPVNPALDSTIVDGALAVLPQPGSAQWLFDEVAVHLPFERPSLHNQAHNKAIQNRPQK